MCQRREEFQAFISSIDKVEANEVWGRGSVAWGSDFDLVWWGKDSLGVWYTGKGNYTTLRN